MSDAFYIEIRDDTVIPVLREFGTTYNVVIPGTQDPTTLTITEPTQEAVYGLVSEGSFVNQLIEAEGAVKQWIGKRVLLLEPDAVVQRGVGVIVDGREHSLDNLEEVKPANINVLYILDLSL